MFRGKILSKILFGNHSKFVNPKGRGEIFTFPGVEEGETDLQIRFRSDDGLILYLLRKIGKLEDRVSALEMRDRLPCAEVKSKK